MDLKRRKLGDPVDSVDGSGHAATRVSELPKRRVLLMDEASTIPSPT